jgi:hypothetical protein
MPPRRFPGDRDVVRGRGNAMELDRAGAYSLQQRPEFRVGDRGEIGQHLTRTFSCARAGQGGVGEVGCVRQYHITRIDLHPPSPKRARALG